MNKKQSLATLSKLIFDTNSLFSYIRKQNFRIKVESKVLLIFFRLLLLSCAEEIKTENRVKKTTTEALLQTLQRMFMRTLKMSESGWMIFPQQVWQKMHKISFSYLFQLWIEYATYHATSTNRKSMKLLTINMKSFFSVVVAVAYCHPHSQWRRGAMNGKCKIRLK